MAVLSRFNYIFAIGTFFALLDVYNNGANDVANSWATSVSSRSITYRWAMVCAFIFEFLGATTVGARTADTIKKYASSTPPAQCLKVHTKLSILPQ